MNSNNINIYVGYVVEDADFIKLRKTPDGDYVTSFTLKVKRQVPDKDGTAYDFFTIVAWKSVAEHCANILNKGMRVEVKGEARTTRRIVKSIKRVEYTDGKVETAFKLPVFEIVADNVQVLQQPMQGE